MGCGSNTESTSCQFKRFPGDSQDTTSFDPPSHLLSDAGFAVLLSALATLGTMQPTSKFGEMFQYSHPLAAAGGYVAAHVLFPELELGAAYDRAMAAEVFAPSA